MPAAIAIPAIIGAVGSVGSAVIGSKASKKAGETQSQAAGDVSASALKTSTGVAGDITTAGDDAARALIEAGKGAAGDIRTAGSDAATGVRGATGDANDILTNVYTDAKESTSPYTAAGELGISKLSDLSDEKFSFSKDDPSYQFRLEEGAKALERSASARGGLNSGGTQKAITRYGQNYAATEYQAAFDRFQTDRRERATTLASLAGYGERAVGQRIAAGTNYGNQASGNLMECATTAGEFDLSSAESAGGLEVGAVSDAGKFRLGAAEGAGGVRMTGERIAGDAKMGGANATAAGTIGSANAWASGISGVANAAQEAGRAKTFRDLMQTP